MNILQKELDEIRVMWNTHVIRHAPRQVSGVPDELYYIPELQGMFINYCNVEVIIIMHFY